MAEAVQVSGTVGKPGAARPLPLTAWAVASPQPAATADTPGLLTVEPESRVALVSLACCAVMAHSGIELLVAEGFLESKPLGDAIGAPRGTRPDGTSGSAPSGEPDHVVVVVAGTVTCVIADRLRATVAHLAARSRVSLVHFGVCTLSGGPYWDSPVVTADGWAGPAAAIIEVSGCPPTARDLATAVRRAVADDSARRS